MKKIIDWFRDFFQHERDPFLYGLTAVFLTACIAVNYTSDFENTILDAGFGSPKCILKYFLFYAFSYYSSHLIIGWRKKTYAVFRKKKFWLFSLFFLGMLGFDGGSPYHRIITALFDLKLHYFVNKMMNQISSVYSILIPTLFLYYVIDREKSSFYGLMKKQVNIKPYLFLLGCMFPLIAAASFDDSFTSYYPTYKNGGFTRFTGIPEWVCVMLYELAYGWDFISVELLFRGIMVIGMIKILGRDAVLPMVCTYAFLHFGKPLGETIGSVFGGFILGVIAFYSRSIIGGIIIHIGVAWLMELAAWLQK